MTGNIVPEHEHSDSTIDGDLRPSTRLAHKNKSLSASRPKLHPIRSSDTSRFPTLERLENTMLQSKSSKITIEPVIFPEYNNVPNSSITNCRKNGSQSDARSVNSSKSNNTVRKKKKKLQSTPTEIFARNLSEAVLDVDDSMDDGYVYNSTDYHNLYPTLLSPPILETSVHDEGSSYFTDRPRQKYRRPGLRSTVSELPVRGVKSFYLESMSSKFEKRRPNSPNFQSPHYRYSSSGEEDEENSPLLYYSSSSGSKRKIPTKSKSCWCQMLTCISVFTILFTCIFFFLLASPLKDIEVTAISNILGTQKQLMFNLHVRARNSNNWNIQLSHSAFSVFAASHVVPTIMDNDNKTRDITGARQEYIGTVNRLIDPLIFEAAPVFYFQSKTSDATSQIQIKNPGETKGDISGNERWSLLIRYPYELTVRGVLKYQIFPSVFSSKVFSARICKIVQVDPITGLIKDVPLPEQSICDETLL
ncbi:hypothetical protein BDF21DRAFT_138266 [Thamnidium elegans]|nr:hypothetical protein BDF21DRAFT_138266 [Thamnidium elegans]